MSAWPLNIPRPSPTILEQIACILTADRIVTPHHNAQRVAAALYPDLYPIFRTQIEREDVQRRREMEGL